MAIMAGPEKRNSSLQIEAVPIASLLSVRLACTFYHLFPGLSTHVLYKLPAIELTAWCSYHRNGLV